MRDTTISNMQMEPLISLRNVSVRYDDGNTALENVNLDIYNGDFTGVIGPNGGGKSTLVKVILGLIYHTGSVAYNGISLKEIGYMPQLQQFDRDFPISVKELATSGLQSDNGLFGRYKSKAEYSYICKLLEEQGLSHLSNTPISDISGGELQRTLLCRALAKRPRMLILDEPTNSVDNRFEQLLYDTLRELSEKMTILMVSHDLGTITSYVRSIVCVNRSVHRHDTAEITPELLENYRCPIQLVTHGDIPHTVLASHSHNH